MCMWLGPLGPLADACGTSGRELLSPLSVSCLVVQNNETVKCLVCAPIREIDNDLRLPGDPSTHLLRAGTVDGSRA